MTEMTDIQSDSPAANRTMLLKWSWRELWHGQLWPVAVALTLIIACVFALAALVVRVEKIMVDQGRSMIAADLVFRSANPVEQPILDKAEQLGLVVSQQVRFGTMAFSDEAMQLVSVKSVESDFPLRGELELKSPSGTHHQVQPGELWLAERLFDLLKVEPGDVLAIGDAELKVSGTIVQEPELSFNPFSQMPAVLIHADDLDNTGAIQPGSRVQYRAYFTGADSHLKALQEQIELEPGQRWLSETSQGRTGDVIEKARQYLSLTLILVILMATATLVLTCMHYASTRTEVVAMMKSLGASKKWLWQWLARQLGMLFGLALVAGVAIGALLEYLLRVPLVDVLPDPLPGIGFSPLVVSVLVALLVAIPGMGIPLLKLVDAPAISVIQRMDSWQTSNKGYLLALLPLAAGLLWLGSNGLMWLTLLGLAAILVILAVVGVAIVRGLKRGRWGPAITLALSRINRSPMATGAQLAALTSSLMLLTVIWLLRSDLLADWQQTLPADAPNVFALNISPEQQRAYLDTLDQRQVMRSEGYPVIRGRITHINEEDLLERSQQGDRQERDESLRRELNLTWRDSIPVHNEVVAGEWQATNGVSVESGIAERLGIALGDTLAFNVNSQPFSAEVTSIREVEWRNMRPNFYFIFTPDVMAELPATWLVSFRIEADQQAVINQLGRDYPTVTLLDLRTMATRIQGIMQQVSLSLSVLAGLGVVSGLLLVMTLLRLSLAQRRDEIRLYRTLGASRKRVSATVWGEYGIMALLAGVMAAAGAEAVVAALVKWGFELPVSWHPTMWLVVPLLSLLLVVLIIRSMINSLLQPVRG
ncbi:ABC transporter permease [Photobacterium rosenbergii]|uniref:FtsX-like permease family protein n=1 Tax=Photobacterium rosenbergii TaxID=294936 RepID=A0ABU3ZLG4_9GAMM|nr:FtsX-like permease family protein [Photobacterium rosenbergii]MDV5170828.1 FtsX-like permease family protein [Photobacterium rosenbergii]